jgi:hypothetical protein
VARTAAGSHSGMDGYELHGHLSEQLFSAIVDYFANFSSSVGSVSEEIYSSTGRLFFLYLTDGDFNAGWITARIPTVTSTLSVDSLMDVSASGTTARSSALDLIRGSRGRSVRPHDLGTASRMLFARAVDAPFD